MSVAEHVGRECTFDALGKPWTASRWSRRVWNDFVEWAKPLVPDPLEVALRHVDAATLKDAEIVRRLRQADLVEEVAAKAEGRPPVMIAPLYSPIANDMVKAAQERAETYLHINSMAIQSVVKSLPGESYLFFLLLRKHQPTVTPDQAEEILEELPREEVNRILATASGTYKAPEKNALAPAA
jgi:hypothetical protein